MKKKILVYGAILLIITLASLVIYRFVFEFKNDDVKALIKAHADKYGKSSNSVYKILQDSVTGILRDSSRVKMIRTYAKETGLSKEKVLVDAAILQAQNLKYIA